MLLLLLPLLLLWPRRSQGLQPAEPFLAKAVQVFETTLVSGGSPWSSPDCRVNPLVAHDSTCLKPLPTASARPHAGRPHHGGQNGGVPHLGARHGGAGSREQQRL